MNRLTIVLGIAVLGLFLLAACSDDPETTSTPVNTSVPATVAPEATEPAAIAEPTEEGPTATAEPVVEEPTATAEPAMEEPVATAEPAIEETAMEVGHTVSFDIGELNGSGQSGTATLTDTGDSTIVMLQISGGSLETELVHIHEGQCGDNLAGVVHPLTNFAGGAGESVTTIDVRLHTLLIGAFAINAHQSGNPGVYTACGNIPADGDSVTFDLGELNGSGQSGTATLKASGDGTVVSLQISDGSLETELVHIHEGQCGDSLAGVVHPLTNFAGGAGESVTTVDASLDSLLTGGFAINAHQAGNLGTYTACGNIPEVVTLALGELSSSGQSGTATLTASGDSTVVSLQLSDGSLETELVHIHEGQCGDSLAGVAHPLTNFVGGADESVTTVDASLDILLTGGFAINAHQAGNPGVYTACGNIPGGAEPVAQASRKASIRQFTHPDLTVAVGTTVVWTNDDRTTHTVTLGANGIGDEGGFESGNLNGGGTFSFTFDTTGTFAYTCRIHPSMNATVEVTGGS